MLADLSADRRVCGSSVDAEAKTGKIVPVAPVNQSRSEDRLVAKTGDPMLEHRTKSSQEDIDVGFFVVKVRRYSQVTLACGDEDIVPFESIRQSGWIAAGEMRGDDL